MIYILKMKQMWLFLNVLDVTVRSFIEIYAIICYIWRYLSTQNTALVIGLITHHAIIRSLVNGCASCVHVPTKHPHSITYVRPHADY